MKRLLFILFIISNVCIGQVGIGTTFPDASSILDISSTESGILIPRMTETQRISIPAPATGLLIYQTNNVTGFWFYNGISWESLSGGGGSGEFQSIGGIVQNTTNLGSDDFVFGNPTLNGTGSRFFFDKSKGAFRAGQTFSTEWDDINVGNSSMAFGSGAIASGANSFAIGFGLASGIGAYSFSGDAAGNNSFAVLANTQGANSFAAIGGNTTPAGTGAFAVGDRASAGGQGAVALGEDTAASANHALAIGQFSSASAAGAIAFRGGIATGQNSFAAGWGTASGTGAFSFSGDAAGNNSFAFLANTQGVSSFAAIGGNTTPAGTGAFAVGDRASAGGQGAVALGEDTAASANHALAIGQFASASAAGAVAFRGGIATGQNSFAAGWGTASGTGAFSFSGDAVGNNSFAFLANTQGANSFAAIGANTTPAGTGAFAVGDRASAGGQGAVALGEDSAASANHALAIGQFASASAAGAIAFRGGIATGQNSFAVGSGAASGTGSYSFSGNATANNSFAFLANTQGASSFAAIGGNSIGAGSLAIMDRSSAEGMFSIALGEDSRATGRSATAIGKEVTAFSYGEIVVGINSLEYTPTNATGFSANDRIFVVGNGNSVGNRNNALTLLKDGRTGLSRIPTTNTLEVEGNASKSTAGDWIANSDARLKKNIETFEEEKALESILNLRGVTYEWSDTKTGSKRPEGIQYGFIAQEIEKVFPENVSLDNLGYYQTAYGTYDAMYVQAIKALHTKLESLEEENAALKKEIQMIYSILTQRNSSGDEPAMRE